MTNKQSFTWIQKNILKIILGITLTISIGFNFKFIFTQQTTNIESPSMNTKGTFNNSEFVYDGRKYTNTTINNYTITNGELKVVLSATDQATGDSVKFASEASIEPAKWDTAVWGQSKWE